MGSFSAVILSALHTGNVSEALRWSQDPEFSKIQLSNEAKELFDMNMGPLKTTFPAAFLPLKDAKRPTRLRSQTCPRTPVANRWGGMEEISNRSAFLALDIDDL